VIDRELARIYSAANHAVKIGIKVSADHGLTYKNMELKREGIPEEVFSILKSPVGLDIGAETPEEIAISIAGEIPAIKKGKLALLRK